MVEHVLHVADGHDRAGFGGERLLGVAMHRVHEAVKHRDGVIDDGLVVAADAVQQPAGQFQLGVEHGALGDVGVAALTCGRIRRDGQFGRVAAGSEQPVQVPRWIADRQAGPAENSRYGIVGDQYGIGRHRPMHHGRSELPEGVVVGGLFPAAQ